MSRTKKFVWWFIAFTLSFLAQSFGLASQGIAFFYLHLIPTILIILYLTLKVGYFTKISVSLYVIICFTFILAFLLLLPWGISLIFNVDFYLVYQFVSFIYCIFNVSLTVNIQF